VRLLPPAGDGRPNVTDDLAAWLSDWPCAPLLFPNIAALAGIGVWDLQEKVSHGGPGSV